MLACLLVLLLGLWSVAIFVTYKDHQRAQYENSIVHPGAVTYGTHSTATIPMASSTHRRSTLPMISGGTIRHYAHSGHATMPEASSKPIMHVSSSATVKTVGGGGNGGGVGMASGSSSSSSSRGIRYGGGYSVSMPVFAMETPTYATNRTNALFSDVTLTSASGRNGHVRTAMPGSGDGDEGTWFDGESDGWWYHDEDGWRTVNVGDTRYDEFLGYVVVWNGSAWVKVTEYDPMVPIGDVPWLCMLCLCVMICIIRKNKVLLRRKS